ncbi:MAG: helix-turn-helix transcriptional regulator [Lachnospiraceae bacterium]|nr:helix-turn-helix transcriptional regulator [Lachnospiraceae bacterium]
MQKLGEYIKELRISHGYSQNKIYEGTGITDSVQSRIERGLNQEISPFQLKKLASFYEISVIDLFKLAGFLTESDISIYKRVFKYSELLTEKQKHNIQEEINFYINGNGGNENAI